MCRIVQDGGQSLKWPSIRGQYPRDIVKPAGMKNDVNSMRSVVRKKLHWRLCYLVLSFAESRKVIKPQCTVSFSSFNRRKKAGRSWGTGIPTCNLCDLICLCLAMIVACPLCFPQRILKSVLESPVDLLVGTPGTLLEFRERGMSLSFSTCLCKRGTTKGNNLIANESM